MKTGDRRGKKCPQNVHKKWINQKVIHKHFKQITIKNKGFILSPIYLYYFEIKTP